MPPRTTRLSRPRARRVLAAVAFALATAGCGGDDGPPAGPSAHAGPLARWRKAAEATADGVPVTIDAVRPCVARLLLWEDGRTSERERRTMAAGDVWRVLVSAVKRPGLGTLDPSPEDRAKGRVHGTAYALAYSSDDVPGIAALFSTFTVAESPWTGVRVAESPPTSLDVPKEPLTLLAVGVAEPSASAAQRLDLSYPPRIAGGGAPEGRRIAAWVLEVVPP